MSAWKLYEIDAMLSDAIAAADEKVDPTTGVLPDDWASFLDEIQIDRDRKILDVAAMIKSWRSEADAIKAEKEALAKRAAAMDKRAERCMGWLSGFVSVGEKLSDSRVMISWRSSTSVQITDENSLPDDVFKVVRTASKTAIKEAIDSGREIKGAQIVKNNNIQIR